MTGAVLLIDVEDRYRAAIAERAAQRGSSTHSIEGKVLEASGTDSIQLCVIGIRRDDPSPVSRVIDVRAAWPAVPIVALAENPSTGSVVELMSVRCFSVIGLPAEPWRVAADLFRTLDGPGDGSRTGVDRIIGSSAAIRALRREIAKLAPTPANVLITGETGTGKGHVARQIHRQSERAGLPFVHVDCATLSASLIESELFGHERGAFTGATAKRAGRFELARGGTIFLDEIGTLDLAIQAKLLRVLQDREYERIGGSTTLRMQARVLSATNEDLREALASGRFRKDLYFRLNVFHLELPPLRKRREDIPELARSLVVRLAKKVRLPCPDPSPEFIEALASRDWPGNIRELENAMERALIRAMGTRLQPTDLDDCMDSLAPSELPEPDPCEESPELANMSDRDRVAAVLHRTGGNVARSARRLGIARSTLRYRIEAYRLSHLIPKD